MLSPPTWSIRVLLPGLPPIKTVGAEDIEITGITHSSQEVKPGYLFVAIKGFAADGHTFIPDAIRRGASCIVLEDPAWIRPDPSILFVQVSDSREALALLSAAYYGHPTKELTLVGITGTNGKTTFTYLLESILSKAGISTGVIGTINYRYKGKTIEAKTTTPDPLVLQRTLREMVSEQVKTVVMEVSSHALALHRVDGCHFDLAVWTNLSRDHLDFHSSMEDYFEAKKALFTRHLALSEKRNKRAVINLDDAYGKRLLKAVSHLPRTTYGTTGEADIHPDEIRLSADGISMRVQTPRGKIPIESPLIGHHNAMNLLAAVSAALALDVPPQAITEGLKNVTVPGRLQPVENPLGITVLIDYAHTPDALKNVLQAIRPLAKGRVITVFGCGGDRDKKKRPIMGAIAEELSDRVILTSDNPRTEPPHDIIDQIERGIQGMSPLSEAEFRSGKRGYIRLSGREEAIRLAIQSATRGDIVLIAGKGHEPYQIIGTQKRPFSDYQVAKKILSEKAGKKE